jgi:protein NrfD
VTIARENPIHWEALVYLEMFVAGIAAGAYMLAAMLELIGRGRWPIARSAHLLAFPLMALAGILLIVDLSRPERFWHMIVMNQVLLPMFKLWSPISFGVWLVLLFPAFAFVSFVDAVLDRGGRRRGATLHGSPLGLVWAIIGGLLAFGVATYSGALLSVTNFPGWSDAPLISALYVATAVVTGLAAIMLIETLRGPMERLELHGLARTSVLLIVWQMVVLALFLLTAAGGWSIFLTGGSLIAIVAAVVLGGLLPLVLLAVGGLRPRPAMTALAAVLILVGGLLLRAGIVMGPQHG